MQILVSDANIIIDMAAGGLLISMFSMEECDFIAPNMLFEEELEEEHEHILELGLRLEVLTSDTLSVHHELVERNPEPGRYNLFALALAKQEECPLLTGDMALRTAAQKEGVEVHGTLWLVERMVETEKISVAAARSAYEKMKEDGSWLPWKLAEANLKKLDKQLQAN